MEFQFTRNTLMGEYYVKCSMGHEIVGRWLQEEIGKNLEKIDDIMQLIDSSQQHTGQEWRMLGREISLIINDDEVTVQENVLEQDQEMEQGSEFDFYNCESTACCGIDDFVALIDQWKLFLTTR